MGEWDDMMGYETPAPTPSETEALARVLFGASGWHPTQWDEESALEFGKRAKLILAAGYVSAEEFERREAAAARKTLLDAADVVAAWDRSITSDAAGFADWLRDRAWTTNPYAPSDRAEGGGV